MHKNRRTRLLIDEFQAKLMRRMVAYWFIYQFTMWNFLFALQLLSEGKGNLAEQHQRFLGSHYPMLIVFAVLVPFFAWDAAKFSHRVAGPIYRFRQTMKSITAGEPIRRVKLRDGDHLTDVADEMNKMLLALESRDAITIDRSTGKPKTSEPAPPENLPANSSEDHTVNDQAEPVASEMR